MPPCSQSNLAYAPVFPSSSALSSALHPQSAACQLGTTSMRASLAQSGRGRILFACSLPILFELIAIVSEVAMVDFRERGGATGEKWEGRRTR